MIRAVKFDTKNNFIFGLSIGAIATFVSWIIVGENSPLAEYFCGIRLSETDGKYYIFLFINYNFFESLILFNLSLE